MGLCSIFPFCSRIKKARKKEIRDTVLIFFSEPFAAPTSVLVPPACAYAGPENSFPFPPPEPAIVRAAMEEKKEKKKD